MLFRFFRLIFGKNKVIAIALGKTPTEELQLNLHEISKQLRNEVGLLFTNKPVQEVRDWFDEFNSDDFARAGNVANTTVHLAEGPLKMFSHSIEPHLRKLQLPVKLDRGVVTMMKDHVLCKQGDVLTPEQANLLKLLGIEMAKFSVTIQSAWNKKDGKFETFEAKEKEQSYNKISITAEGFDYETVEKEEVMKVE